MSHERRPGMVKIAIRSFSSSEIDKIANSANCTVEDVKFILDIINKHFKKKKYVDISDISKHTTFLADKVIFIINSINSVYSVPIVESLQSSQKLIFRETLTPYKKEKNDGTKNPGPMVTAKIQKKTPKGKM